jgi:serine protease SohB
MMAFLADYGLFAIKTITLVLALLFLLAGIFAISKKSKPKLEIHSLNEEYEDIQSQMLHKITGKKAKAKKIGKKDKKKLQERPSLFVTDFHGDIKASQVDQLREVINAILSVATDKDEILVRVESPGGSVNGYGLAASQLQRIRDKNIKLTIAIDKMAASGGYLMACVANEIISAPFAIIGSIGVVAQLPNIHRWLKKHDVDVELITAGEYKRTLTLLGENTEKGRKKFQEDIELIHKAFRNYVLEHRESLDIEKVSTGEHWLAKDAFELKLLDKLQTSDDYIIEKLNDFNAYRISWHVKEPLTAKFLKPAMRLLQPWS